MLQDMKGAKALGLHSHGVKITFQYSLDTTLNIFANYIFMYDALKLDACFSNTKKNTEFAVIAKNTFIKMKRMVKDEEFHILGLTPNSNRHRE